MNSESREALLNEQTFEEISKKSKLYQDSTLALSALVIHTIGAGLTLESTKKKMNQLYLQNGKEFDEKSFEKLSSPKFIRALEDALLNQSLHLEASNSNAKKEEVKEPEKKVQKPKEVEVDFSAFF